MTAASALQVTRVTSSPRSLLSRVQCNKQKRVGGPVATLPRVTMAIDGRIVLMTSRDAFDVVTVGEDENRLYGIRVSTILDNTEAARAERSKLTVRQ